MQCAIFVISLPGLWSLLGITEDKCFPFMHCSEVFGSWLGGGESCIQTISIDSESITELIC